MKVACSLEESLRAAFGISTPALCSRLHTGTWDVTPLAGFPCFPWLSSTLTLSLWGGGGGGGLLNQAVDKY